MLNESYAPGTSYTIQHYNKIVSNDRACLEATWIGKYDGKGMENVATVCGVDVIRRLLSLDG